MVIIIIIIFLLIISTSSEPKTSSTSGLGITDIRSKVASVSFHHVLPAKGFAWYQTFTVAPNGKKKRKKMQN